MKVVILLFTELKNRFKKGNTEYNANRTGSLAILKIRRFIFKSMKPQAVIKEAMMLQGLVENYLLANERKRPHTKVGQNERQ